MGSPTREQAGAARGAAVLRALDSEIERVRRATGSAPVVLDVGGGSGTWAVPLAGAGCRVTVVDTSHDALATLARRADEAGVTDRISPVNGDVDALADVAPADGADLVLGHGLLEVVDDPGRVLSGLAAAAAPGGAVSVLTVGRYGAFVNRVTTGRLAEARRLLTDPAGRTGPDDSLLRRFDAQQLRELAVATGRLGVETLQGDGTLEALLPGPGPEDEQSGREERDELDALASAVPALGEVAPRLHLLGRRH
ncbi:class I SAM-dependent methyltransferase [Pseudonocardia sp. HH130630-07]|uniref:class I SAM-dependent methyltransferase n=1 Tax=Pseudonocardia sp. HH130630-07 TaxID=1690815 RepID=UPI00081515F2|nr:class I SAM-dependent methyltransferase [Pseudonocardia sp. HH130630-07]ANY09682.1 methyltransferase [Pseudonocardia sp. HH130630-07]